MGRLMLVVLTFLLIVIPPRVYAQDRGVSGTASSPPTGPQKWAVVIGVGDYQDAGIGDLPNAVNDARAVKEMLVTMPDGFPAGNVMLLADGESPERLPTRSNIIRFLSSRLSLAGPDDTVLVYFAGHGTTEKGALYLLPNDAAGMSVAQTGYAFAELEQLLKQTPAKKRILLLDACHSGTGRANESLSTEAIQELERASQGIVTLASCSGDEKSHEMSDTGHGAFTYFLLDALTGKADTNSDGAISAGEASVYTWDATRRWASEKGLKQTPWRREEVSGDIILAKTGGQVPTALFSAVVVSTSESGVHANYPSSQGGAPVAVVGKWVWETPLPYAKRSFSCESIDIDGNGGQLVLKVNRPQLSGVNKEKNFTITETVGKWTGNSLEVSLKTCWSWGGFTDNGRIEVSLTPTEDYTQLSGHGESFGHNGFGQELACGNGEVRLRRTQ